MKIFFDARWTRFDTLDGIGRFGASLIEALAKQHPVTMLIYDKRQLKLLPAGVPYVIVNNPLSIKEFFLPRRLNELGADVVYSPMQIMGTRGRHYKLIFTLHDMIYYHYPKPPTHLPAIVRLVWWLFHQAYWPQRWILNRADYIVTVSETSKHALAEHHLTDRPIGVVYNAPSLLGQVSNKQPIQKELVYMGSFMPYKNVEALITMMSLLPEYRLHLVSRIAKSRRIALEKLIKHPEQVQFWNGINDQQYATLLARATALVTASYDEGFGLPLIEAMAAGTPVVCSDIPIFHEVGGEAAMFCDPHSPAAFAAAVQRCHDPTERQTRIDKGRQQAVRFSWDASAAQLLAIMQQITTPPQKTQL